MSRPDPRHRLRPARSAYPVARGVEPPAPAVLQALGIPELRPVPRRPLRWPWHLLVSAGALAVLTASAAVGYYVSLKTRPRADQAPVASASLAPADEPHPPPVKGVPVVEPEPQLLPSHAAAPPPSQPAITPPTVKQSAPVRAAAAVSFAADVRPILQAKCVPCHGNADKRKGGLDVRTLDALRRGGDTGPAFVAGRAEQSLLWESVASDQMPPGKAKLSAAEKDTLRRWIEGGAK